MEAISQGQKLFLTRLGIGLAQGLILYLLYRASDAKLWPATHGAVFIPLLLVSLSAPIGLNLSLGAMPLRKALTWVGIASAVVALLGFFDAWMGASQQLPEGAIPSAQLIFFGAGGLFIAHTLVTGGVAQGRFMASYATYFDLAWKLGIQLVLSVFFVGAFWALMWLGAGLFGLIKLSFLEGLLGEAWFSIPVLAVAAGGALHLTDVRPTLVQGARTLALTLLSWLLPLITLMVAGFVASLPFTGLQALWSFGHATALLLAATAALLILINAAHQDGAPERTPPKVLQVAGTVAALLTVPLTLIAAYALSLRVRQYGWTVDRVTVAAILIVALAYAGGYAHAALTRGRWLAGIEEWNFRVALLALGLMIVMFTPLASPLRISVNDQMARLQSGKVTPQKFDYAYLRWEGGRYGQAALAVLSRSQNAYTRLAASDALKRKARYEPYTPAPALLAQRVTVYPRGTKLPESFLKTDWNRKQARRSPSECMGAMNTPCDAVLLDLNGDGRQEIVMFAAGSRTVSVFHSTEAGWFLAATFEAPCPGMLEALRSQKFEVMPPAARWNDLMVAGRRLRLNPGVQDGADACAKAGAN
ncbi:MAG: DUF4153 domain-containing protein [Pseudomonadota bacterium]